ncbi:MAG: MiaB/RimO family radical SAM methylthiotransferase [Anaerolineae bacterium]
MKRYHVWTIGCQMNVADSRGLAADLEGLGYAWTDDPEAADVVVLNTCVVRQPVEDKVYGRLGSLLKTRRERPGMVVALMGCLVGQGEARRLRSRFPDVDVFLPPATTRPLLDYLRGADLDGAARRHEARSVAGRWAAQDAGLPAPSRLPLRDRGRVVSAHVPIIHGCSWVCTFCIIPARRGPERSRPAEAVVQDVEALVAEGVREVILLGQIVDRYGHDRDDANALPHLLRRLNDVEHLERIRFLTSHPAFLSDELLAAVAELPKVMEQIEIPLQAGHDRTLARMKRGYTVDEYCRLVARVRESVPDPAIHTDIIVGFPGETEEEFEATYRVVEALRLDKVHIAKFSSRPGTVAAKLLVDDVSTGEKERRRRSLDGLQERIRGEINAALVG